MPSLSFADPSEPRYTLVANFGLDESKLPGRPLAGTPPRVSSDPAIHPDLNFRSYDLCLELYHGLAKSPLHRESSKTHSNLNSAYLYVSQLRDISLIAANITSFYQEAVTELGLVGMQGWPLATAQNSLVKPILCMPSFWDEPKIYYDWSTSADLESILLGLVRSDCIKKACWIRTISSVGNRKLAQQAEFIRIR